MSNLPGASYPTVSDSKVGDKYTIVRDGNVRKQTRSGLEAYIKGQTLAEVRKGGPTSNRPENPEIFELYFDTDLNMVIVWDGVAWGGSPTQADVDQRVIFTGSIAGLETLADTALDGDAARLVSGTGRDGDFRWDSSDLSGTLVLASVTSTSVDDTTDTINKVAHGLGNGMGVIAQASVNGLSANTVYWVISATDDTFQLSASYAGSAVDLTGTTNFTVDHLLDPRQIIWVTPTADRTGASGAWRREFSGRISALWSEAIADYDPVPNTGTDNTHAIQAAINLSARLSIWETYCPAGFYKFANLYFHYDQTDNGDYPQDDDRQGRMRLVGDGRMSPASYQFNLWGGTALYSESSSGVSAIYAAGTGSTGAKHKGDASRLEHLSVVVDNSTLAVFMNKAPQNSGIDSVFLAQKGSGGGFLHDSVWFCNWKNSYIQGAGKAVSLGKGFQVRNTTLSGGAATIDNVAADGFQYPIWLGAEDRASAEQIHSLEAFGLQGSSGVVGVHIGAGVVSSSIKFHAEGCDLAYRVLDNARDCELSITTSGNTKGGEFGSTDPDKNYYNRITVHTSRMISPTGQLMEIFSSANTSDLTIETSSFEGGGANTAIQLQDVVHHNLRINNVSFINVGTEITHPSRVAELTLEDSFQWTAGQTSQPLTEIPFRFRQGSLVGAQPVVEVSQQDGDQPFITLTSPVTPVGTNYNNVTELNGDGSVVGPQAKSAADGWSFRAMVAVQLDTGDGVETVYMPVYSADPI